MSVTQEASEEQRIADSWRLCAARALSVGGRANPDQDRVLAHMTAELQRTRTASVDILVGPAHIIGSALCATVTSRGDIFRQRKRWCSWCRGERDQGVEGRQGQSASGSERRFARRYLALGEFNSKGLQLKSYFQQIRNYSSHE